VNSLVKEWLQLIGSTLCMPYYLALKAQALHLAQRTSEALEAFREAETLAETLVRAAGVPNCTDCTVCF
jgi:hypothetical protein